MKGILLINLGSPKDLNLESVKIYLKEFLEDELVIDIPAFLRKILVNNFIVPFRAKKTLEAYKAIWKEDGSPLIINTRSLKEKLQKEVTYPIEFAMRYQEPSIELSMKKLIDKGCTSLIILPLYPHYAMATSLTTIRKVEEINNKLQSKLKLKFIKSFHNNSQYIHALSSKIKPFINNIDYLLFSYHGIPKSHLTKMDPTGSHCLKSKNCCQVESEAKQYCYKSQVLETSRLCASSLELKNKQWGVAFQSRIGPGWLKPFSDIEFKELPKKGFKNIAVVCPSFLLDNLETLEEVQIRGRETFISAGGENFHYIPCLNQDDLWIDCLTNLI
tara:strand:+ start:23648 stop:24637 length:990 start_codon:yes stop_codon:yes gene_type:complete